MAMNQFTSNPSNCASTFVTKNFTASEKKDLAIKVISKAENVTQLAAKIGVNRNYLYGLADIANKALYEAFEDKTTCQDHDDTKILFYFPVTKKIIQQIVIALVLICHSSIRGVKEFLGVIFNYEISVGTVFNILHDAIEKAEETNKKENLCNIKVAALDEIYHRNKPVFVATDVDSTYISLLKQEKSCNGETWAANMLDLSKNKKLDLKYSVADGGKGLRAGQKEAWPTVPCHADIFHAIKDLNELRYHLEKHAYGRLAEFYKLQDRLRKPKKQTDHKLLNEITDAKVAMTRAIKLADDVAILVQWMREDILCKVGANYNERVMLFNFIVSELALRERMAAYFIRPVRKKLSNQRNDLLAFVVLIDNKLQELADKFNVSLASIRKAYELHAIATENPRRRLMEQEASKELGACFHLVEQEIAKIIDDSVRASSCTENVNSRLRPYFFLRKQLGAPFLELLKFFLNHRPYMRSKHSERIGKSPAELLEGKPHKHWLEMLGFQLFKQQRKASMSSTEACA
jgi:6-pyruvoyl-tetrahydropterin synthase